MKNTISKFAKHAAAWGLSALLLVTAIPAAGSLPGISATAPGNKLQTETTVVAARRVYYATHSRCYHINRNCRTLARSRNVYTTSIRGARAKHLRPCRVCTR